LEDSITQFEANLKQSIKELKLLDKAGLELCKKMFDDWLKSLTWKEVKCLRELIGKWISWKLSYSSTQVLTLVIYLTHVSLNRDRIQKISLEEIAEPLHNFSFVHFLLSSIG